LDWIVPWIIIGPAVSNTVCIAVGLGSAGAIRVVHLVARVNDGNLEDVGVIAVAHGFGVCNVDTVGLGEIDTVALVFVGLEIVMRVQITRGHHYAINFD
jgi:hypothetical protein